MKIKMVSIPVLDPIMAFKQYTEVLGFDEFMYDPKGQLAIVVSPDDPKGTALLLEPNTHELSENYRAGLKKEKIPAITFGVDDIKAEYIRLVNLDIQFIKEPTLMAWGWEAIFDDNCGNYIQLIQV